MQPIWTEETQVYSYETDFQERWKPACFFQRMQETATHHASHLGFDYAEMLRERRVWVLSRMKICFERFPALGERLIIRTWPKGIRQRILFYRDFEFETASGERLARATSAWLLLDPVARRMLTPQALPGSLPDNEGLNALDENLEKIAAPDDLPEQFVVQARYGAVDLMGHVNNARYAEWACDCFDLAHFRAHPLAWMQVNYVNEVRPGERVSMRAGEHGASCQVLGMNLDTGARAFEAALGWG